MGRGEISVIAAGINSMYASFCLPSPHFLLTSEGSETENCCILKHTHRPAHTPLRPLLHLRIKYNAVGTIRAPDQLFQPNVFHATQSSPDGEELCEVSGHSQEPAVVSGVAGIGQDHLLPVRLAHLKVLQQGIW